MVTASSMGMYFKHQQANSRLHSRLTHQLDKHLNSPKPSGHVAATTADFGAEKAVVSFKWTLFIVLVSGGCVALLLALVERQNPSIIASSIEARTLAILGLAGIVLGCLTLLAGRYHKTHHA